MPAARASGYKRRMERTSIRLGGVALQSTIMNASGPRSAERGEIYELSAVHVGAIVFKSCNIAGLEAPENLKNLGVEHFAAIARELAPRSKKVIGSIVGTTEDEFVAVAKTLDRAGVAILELNLADDYVANSLAPFASFERLKSLIGRVRGEVGCAMAVKLPPKAPFSPRALADLLKATRVAIAVCQNDLPKDLEIDIATGTAKGPVRPLSHAHAFFRESEGLLDIVAVGGINTGRDAYIAHLAGAKALQVGSALIKEGAGALGRIDRELDGLLADNGKRSVEEIIGKIKFAS
ncbi:MAG: hypothetical protein ACLQDV_29660 [Candidatus Binataceae bacterium]